MEDEQPAVQFEAMAVEAPSSPAADRGAGVSREMQRQQQEQLAYYANLHRQRLQAQSGAAAGGAAAANAAAPGGRAAQLLAEADAANAALPQYEERLLDVEDIALAAPVPAPIGQYRMPDGRLVGDLSLEAFRARSAVWIKKRIAWQQRSSKNAAVLVATLLVLLSVCTVLVGLGAHHLPDDFNSYVTHDPSDAQKQNSCAQLPIFLIIIGAIGISIALLLFVITALAAKDDERLAFRASFPLLVLLVLLSSCFLLFYIVGVVWLTTTRSSECPTQLYRTALFTVLATLIVGTLQAMLVRTGQHCCRLRIG